MKLARLSNEAHRGRAKPCRWTSEWSRAKSQRSSSSLSAPPVTTQWNVGVIRQVAGPRVQHRGDAQFSAEAFRVSAQLEQGLGGAAEQRVIGQHGVAVSDAQFREQCENDVEVVRWKHTLEPARDPLRLRPGGTLGAMAVVARVVGRPHARHTSTWPPSSNVRQVSMALSTARSLRVRRWTAW
jgi:hypothetical protein